MRNREEDEYSYFADFIIKKDVRLKITRMKLLLEERAKYTPDFIHQRKYENILMFVCCDLMTHGKNHSFMKHGKYLGHARTMMDTYIVKQSDKSGPIVFPAVNQQRGGYVLGEVYAITPMMMLDIDEYKRNGILHNRSSRSVSLTDQTYKTSNGGHPKHPVVQAFMYLGSTKIWPFETMPPVSCTLNGKQKKTYQYFPRTPVSLLNDNHHPLGPTWERNMEFYPHGLMH